MRILIDGQSLFPPLTGIGLYTQKLYSNMDDQNDNQVDLWFNQLLNNKHKQLGIKQEKIINNRYPYKMIRRLMKPNLLHEVPIANGYNIFHGTNFLLYNTPKTTKNILTIHDLAFLYFPEVTDDKTYRHHKLWLPYSIEKADQIITVSQNTKEDVMQLYGVEEDKITVTYLGNNERLFEPSNISAKLENLEKKVTSSYFLFVGTIEPRKNLQTLISVFAKLKKEHNIKQKLVLVGKKGWKSDSIYKAVYDFNLENEVLFLGYLDDEDLSFLYSKADLFLFPSIYEGFGLPVIEAMKFGIPVISSSASCLPEIIGKAGITVEPQNEMGWVNEILALLNDDKLYKELKYKGIERAKIFNWENTIKQTKKVYKGVL